VSITNLKRKKHGGRHEPIARARRNFVSKSVLKKNKTVSRGSQYRPRFGRHQKGHRASQILVGELYFQAKGFNLFQVQNKKGTPGNADCYHQSGQRKS
jgi:hypothetical protein